MNSRNAVFLPVVVPVDWLDAGTAKSSATSPFRAPMYYRASRKFRDDRLGAVFLVPD